MNNTQQPTKTRLWVVTGWMAKTVQVETTARRLADARRQACALTADLLPYPGRTTAVQVTA